MQKDYKKLILVEVTDNPKKGKAAQSNKFYEMIWEGGSSFTVKYGRVEATSTTISYPYSQWDSKYREKLRKGYKDVTDFVTVVVDSKPDKYIKIGDISVEEFMTLMKRYTDNLVSTTYSVKADAVSVKQVNEAQRIIDVLNITDRKNVKEINELLVSLYTVIPRKMKDVKDNILPKIKLDDTLVKEQDNLDAMALQVNQLTPKKSTNKSGTLLDSLGVTMKEISPTEEIKYLVDQCKKGTAKIHKIFEVNKKTEDEVFSKWLGNQKNKQTRILIHGTRCSSIIPILEIGLKIRPKGNFQFSGKAYGDGNYYSETVNKSLNYTGWQTDKILLVYEVHTGKPFTYNGWYTGNSFTLNYENLQKRGFDSTFVSAGNGLLNSEIIAYKEQQNRIKYIIWLK